MSRHDQPSDAVLGGTAERTQTYASGGHDQGTSGTRAFRTYLDDLKARTDLSSLMLSHGLTLDQRGMTQCPFHDDHTPSLHVDRNQNVWHCFGCQRGGDAVAFLREIREGGFREAVDALADVVGAHRWSWRSDVDTAPPLPSSIRHAILRATVEFYEAALVREHRDELRQSHGILPETLTRHRVGYGRPGLRRHLVEGLGFQLEDCITAGVLTQSGTGTVSEPLQGRIVFPNVLYGRIMHLTAHARGAEDGGPKWRHISGKIEHLYNEVALRAPKVVLVEGPLDCLAVEQLGFRSVAVYGTQKTLLHSKDLDHIEHLFIALDPDEAGRRAADDLARGLGLKGRVVDLPEGQDPADFIAAGGSRDEFQTLLDEARPWVEREVERVKAQPVWDRASGLRKLAEEAARADAATRPLIYDVVTEARLLSKNEFGQLISDIGETDHAAEQERPSPPPLSDEERAEALALLRDERLLEHLLDDLDRLDCVGEDDNKITLFLAMVSRLLERPISVVVKGDSSGGKSHIVEQVAKLQPEGAVLEASAISPKALFHMKDRLAHRVLIIYERPGAEETDYPLRTLLSEGQLRYFLPVQNTETNEWETQEVVVEGPVSLIETTTAARLHEENETRCFDVFVDESEEQTRRIVERQRIAYERRPIDASVVRIRWQNLQRVLQPLPVRIPYAGVIEFPTERIRARRDQMRFLALIEASGLLHQEQRETECVSGQTFVLAGIRDYAVAYELAKTLLRKTVRPYSPKCEEMLRMAWPEIDPTTSPEDLSGQKRLLRRDLEACTGWSKKTVLKLVAEAEESGLVDISRPGPGQANAYELIRLPDKHTVRLLSPEEIQRRWEERGG